MIIRLTNKIKTLIKPHLHTHKQLRTILCLAIMIGAGLFSNAVQAQTSRININAKSTNLKDVISQIEKQTDYLFVYTPSEIDLNKKTSLNLKDKSIKEALAAAFDKTDITYHIEGNNVMLMKQAVSAKKESKKITGTIVDENGDPLPGATVSVRGTTDGTITDIDGKFEIRTSVGNTLVISYISYNSENIVVTEKNQYDVKLTPVSNELGAVVVTALGIKRSQKALSYNAQEIKQDALTQVKDANFINALSGKVAGVTINSSSSGVGGASKVVMRGAKSISQSNNALYVIDGIPMFNTGSEGSSEFGSQGSTESIADINPEDIESLTVLTGAAAAALYGNNASNGVIVVTTKKGKTGKLSLTFSQNTEFLSPFVLPKFQNSYGSGTAGANVSGSDLSWGSKLNSSNYMGYNPRDDYFKTGVVTTESLGLSVGDEKNQTYVSMSAVNSDGVIPNNTYDRLNFSIRNTTSMLNDKLTLDVGATYIKQKDNNMVNQGIYQNPLVSAYLFPRGGDWNDVKMYEQWDSSRKINTQRWDYGLVDFTGQNPYWINHRNLRKNTKDRYMLNGTLSYKILDWLSVAGRIRTDFSATKYTEKLYATTNSTITDGSDTGYFGYSTYRDRQTYADIMLNINKQLTEDISLSANVGASVSDQYQDYITVKGPLVNSSEANAAIPNKFNIMQIDRNKMKPYEASYQEQNQAYFMSSELGYKSAYYLTLTARYDRPSQLAGPLSTTSGFFYPSVGTSFILSEILPMPKQINYLKLRSSFASVGIPFSRNLAQVYYEWSEKTGEYKENLSHYPIDKLKEERTNSWEIGVTTRFLQNFKLDVSLYHAKSFNQTFNAGISASSGYDNFYVQTGNVVNKGIEISLGYENTWSGLTWSSNYTFSANKNKIKELAEDFVNPVTGKPTPITRLDKKALGDATFILKKGGTLGDLYSVTDLQRDANGDIYVNEEGKVTKVSVAEDPIKLGSVFPKANMAWRNDFNWKNFNLGFMISARLGGIVYSATQATLDAYGVSEASANARDAGGFSVDGVDTLNPQAWFQTIGISSGIPQFYTYSATNVRLQEVSLGYTFTKDKLWNIGDVTVSLVGRNLLMIYNKAPFDPESVASTGNYYQGIDYFMMPSNRSMGFNVKVRF